MIITLLLLYLALIELIGILLSYALFSKHLSVFEHLTFGFILGLIVPNALYATAYLLLGLEFSMMAWLGVVVGIGVISGITIGVRKIKGKRDNNAKEGI
jgi:polyferredoxin